MMKFIGKSVFTAMATGLVALGANAADIEIDGSSSIEVDGTSTNGTTLYVGRYDANNHLTITNGGAVSAKSGYIGQNSAENTLLVTGSNSSLQLSESLSIGENGGGNTLTLTDGGRVSIGGTNGTANAISIGNTVGTANLSMDTGAIATADFLYVGTASNENGSVSLTGNSTELIIEDSAFIGMEGFSNTVTLSDGATLTASNLLQVGSSTSSNNTLVIGNNGKVVISGNAEVHNPGSNAINIDSGGQLTYTADANLGQAEDNGFNFASGSTLEIGGSLTFGEMNSGLTVVLNNSLNTNLTSSWDTGTDEMYVGDTVGGNTLILQDGASATAGGSTAHIGEESNNNTINVIGSNSTLTVEGTLIAGMKGDQNKLEISGGGAATVGSDLRVGFSSGAATNEIAVSGTNSTLDVLGNAIIGEKGKGNTLSVSNATLNIGKSLYIGKTGSENTANFTGSNTMAAVGGNLLIGDNGDGGNDLYLENAASLSISGNAFLGTNSASNKIFITGTNTWLDIAGNLSIGNLVETNENTGNSFSVFDSALATVGGDMAVRNGSSIQIEAGSQLTIGGNYWQDETSMLEVSVGTNGMERTNMVVSGEARFSTNTSIKVFDDGIGIGEFEQVIVSSTGLYIGSTNATSTLLNDTNSINFVNDLLDVDGIVTNESIVLKTVRLSIAEKSGIEGTVLEPLADEIDGMALTGNTNALAMRNILGIDLVDADAQRNAAMEGHYGEKMSSMPAHNAINMGLQSVAEQLTKRTDNTRARMGTASASTPEGAGGPHMDEQELQGWMSGYGTWADKSASGGFDGYSADIHGFMIGADLSIAEGILVGISGGSGSSTLDKDNGASADTETTFGSIYASAGTKDWFVDASLIYGSSSVDSTLGTVFGTTAEYDAQNIAIYLGGGKEIIGNYLIFTPQASLLGNYYKQDAYAEKSSSAVARDVDSFDAFYLQSSIGCNIGFYTTMGDLTVKPEIRAFWLHEFNAEDETLPFSLVGGTGNYTMLLQAPEEDVIKIGTGFSAKLSEYLELRADLDTRFASDYSDYTLLGSLRYQF